MIRRAPQVGESSQAGTKIALRPSSTEEFKFLPPSFLEENQRAFDEEDLKTAHRMAQEEADQANAANPLKSQLNALKKIEKSKDEDIEWCSKKTIAKKV